MGISVQVLEQVLINAMPVASLDALISHDDHRDLSAVLGCNDSAPDYDDRDAQHLRSLIHTLPERDQRILSLTWGLDGEQMPQAELAASCGMSMRGLECHLICLYHQLHAMTQPNTLSPVAVSPVRRRRRNRTDGGEQLSLFCLADPAPTQNAAVQADVMTA